MKLIKRTPYLNRLLRLRGTPDIKIITGIRRCGKSELVKSYIKILRGENKNTNIIYIDYTDLRFDDIKDYKSLYRYAEDNYKEDAENVLIVDEVQMCDKFELAINSLHGSGKYDIYITGSNAFLLSSDLSTLFTGRFIEIPVYPFSYSEYCEYFGLDGRAPGVLDGYIHTGGLAGSYVYENEEDRNAYITDVYNTIIRRDLVDKYKINEVSLFESLTEFLMDNISNLTSPNKISTALSAGGTRTNHVTVGNYLKYLCNAFMFYKVKRYDIRGKKYLATSDKYYLCDTSFRHALLGGRNADWGRAYENAVAIELMRRGYSVWAGMLYNKGIDFVAMKRGEKLYIQVSDNISDPETLNRELDPLRKINDSYAKMLIANTGHEDYDIEGIKICDISRRLSI